MRRDTDAIGGFFEDLPVLAFVLAGVLSVASTACWAADQLTERDVAADLSRDAARALRAAVASLMPQDHVPTLESVRSANLTGVGSVIGEGRSCMVSVWALHPRVLQVLAIGELEHELPAVCSAETLLNAVSDDGLILILEVRAVVWRSSS